MRSGKLFAPGSLLLLLSVAVSPVCGDSQGRATSLTTVRIASGLLRPVGLAAPDGDFNRIFVIEKQGRVRVIENGSLVGTPVMDINSSVGGGSSQNDERGLLGIAFHPDYLQNGFFYLFYTNNSSDTVVARYQMTGDPATSNTANPSSELILLTIGQPETNHNGGCLKFGPDGKLYIASGDGGGGGDNHGTIGNGQNLGTLLGKLLRIDVDIAAPYIPADNPFFGPGDPLDEIWAYGLRNPWRFTFDRETGDLYIGDVGQNNREEIDFVAAGSSGGENYGWRCMEGTACFNASAGPNCTCNGANLTDPIHDYQWGLPQSGGLGFSITGGEVYRGCTIPDLQGTYFYADYVSDRIWSLRVVGGVATEIQERTSELAPGGGFNLREIASFGLDSYGEIYIVEQGTSSNTGEVFKIVPDTAGPVRDCNSNSSEDACEILDGSEQDVNEDGVPDSCLPAEVPVPTMSEWGLVTMALLTLIAGTVAFRRRRIALPQDPGR